MERTAHTIKDVSDTSIWVAYYRAKESERTDALFRDHLAGRLVGARGRAIAESMGKIGRYTEWSVLSRTVIIDEFLQRLIAEGADTVINLGAGLDTRPYRMQLPSKLNWIEVDYAHVNEHKQKVLAAEKPNCNLTRVNLNLGDHEQRKNFLAAAAASIGSGVILTEGVIPYLTEEHVADLAADIHSLPQFTSWIAEYFDPRVYRYLKATVRVGKMLNAPFQFYPSDWNGFFQKHNWAPTETRYSGEEAVRLGRTLPMPWWAPIALLLSPKSKVVESRRMSGYSILKPMRQQRTTTGAN